jgi:hypothetical protein
VPEKPGRPKKTKPKRGEPLRIDLPFDEAIRAALETTPKKSKGHSRAERGASSNIDQDPQSQS